MRLPQDARERGDQEGGRLARPRLGLARDVLAPERQRERGLLDRGGGDEPRLADAPHDRFGEVEGRELHGYLTRSSRLDRAAFVPSASSLATRRCRGACDRERSPSGSHHHLGDAPLPRRLR